MKSNLVEKETSCICGYSVETTLEENDMEVSALYQLPAKKLRPKRS